MVFQGKNNTGVIPVVVIIVLCVLSALGAAAVTAYFLGEGRLMLFILAALVIVAFLVRPALQLILEWIRSRTWSIEKRGPRPKRRHTGKVSP